MVSYRMSDELGVAVRLSLSSLDATNVREALHKVLNDEQFFIRVDRLSKISHEYPGYKNGAKAIMDFIEK